MIRAEYGYTDEYILSKTPEWIQSSIEMIKRRKRDDQIEKSIILSRTYFAFHQGKQDLIPEEYDALRMQTQEIKSKEIGFYEDDFMSDSAGDFSNTV